MENVIPTQLSTLGHPQRLAIWRLLMRRHPQALPAGEIAEILHLKPSTLSVYLGALRATGLIAQHRQGTSLRYSAEVGSAGTLLDYLFNDCCRGRPETCLPGPGRKAANRLYNVLFICSGNSARSIFAETLLRHLAGDRFNAFSAGTAPRSELNPVALETLRAKGHDISGLRAKSIRDFQGPEAPQMDFVFTVCDAAANEDCPAWDGQPVSAHWGLPDPVAATGTEAERALAFQQAYGLLLNRLRAFTALPLAELDRISLQRAVDGIATQTEPAP
ncbi:helix-turn-helix domain-containing protein [Pseudooceanicola sp. CBS1P-1]|uniref:Helix-turn-helix domain-containing protein n=1 Tax=Pseudooceanicola albus TaxID=2692189 RepID=A0A6L7G7X3_9RHOB|nr:MULTISPECIES: helix-turn-helix domain-containing protein [Pseudooceanicola]MBT9384159.1 helix-turn-helix domain-containing protein [Pseudooceanicola endophyticus]MXN19742.1 helix-turn-helix domain-containing protein [Pseudooceanicola albus]